MIAYIVRGLPGTGKSTLAAKLAPDVASADDFMVGADGTYQFNPANLSRCHMLCMGKWERWIREGRETIAVANTFSCEWEWLNYRRAALLAGYQTVIIDLFDGGGEPDAVLAARNVHGVPVATIAAMRKRWEK